MNQKQYITLVRNQEFALKAKNAPVATRTTAQIVTDYRQLKAEGLFPKRKGRSQNAAQKAASVRNWNTFQIKGAIGNLQQVFYSTSNLTVKNYLALCLVELNRALAENKK